MVPIAGYYLGVTPPMPSGYSHRPQSMSNASLPATTSVALKNSASRQSLPAIRHATPPAPAASTPGPIHEEEGEEGQPREEVQSPSQKSPELRHKSNGTMDRNFKFPPSQSEAQVIPVVPPIPFTQSPVPKPEPEEDSDHESEESEEDESPVTVIPPSSVEVPPPPPIEKENHRGYAESEEGDEEVGETEEIDLR